MIGSTQVRIERLTLLFSATKPVGPDHGSFCPRRSCQHVAARPVPNRAGDYTADACWRSRAQGETSQFHWCLFVMSIEDVDVLKE